MTDCCKLGADQSVPVDRPRSHRSKPAIDLASGKRSDSSSMKFLERCLCCAPQPFAIVASTAQSLISTLDTPRNTRTGLARVLLYSRTCCHSRSISHLVRSDPGSPRPAALASRESVVRTPRVPTVQAVLPDLRTITLYCIPISAPFRPHHEGRTCGVYCGCRVAIPRYSDDRQRVSHICSVSFHTQSESSSPSRRRRRLADHGVLADLFRRPAPNFRWTDMLHLASRLSENTRRLGRSD